MLPQLRTLLNIWYLQASNCNDHHGSAEQGQVCHLIEHYASVKQGHELSDPMCAHCTLQRPHKKLITGHDGGLWGNMMSFKLSEPVILLLLFKPGVEHCIQLIDQYSLLIVVVEAAHLRLEIYAQHILNLSGYHGFATIVRTCLFFTGCIVIVSIVASVCVLTCFQSALCTASCPCHHLVYLTSAQLSKVHLFANTKKIY